MFYEDRKLADSSKLTTEELLAKDELSFSFLFLDELVLRGQQANRQKRDLSYLLRRHSSSVLLKRAAAPQTGVQ